MTNIVAIIQARMGSTRLPGKVMRILGGMPVVSHVINRVRATPGIDKIVVATSNRPTDDILADFLKTIDVAVYRGAEKDVLNRFAQAARTFGGETIVRITADDPVKDPAVIGKVVHHFVKNSGHFDYVSNTIQATFPLGQDTEVFSAASLFEAEGTAHLAYDREHVTSYIYTHPEQFSCGNFEHYTDLSSHRWTLDTEQDFEFLDALFDVLGPRNASAGMNQILEVLKQHPEIAALETNIKRHAVVG